MATTLSLLVRYKAIAVVFRKEVHVHLVVQLTPVFTIEGGQIEYLMQFCCKQIVD